MKKINYLLAIFLLLATRLSFAEDKSDLELNRWELKSTAGATYWQKESKTTPESVEHTDKKLREIKDQSCPPGMVMAEGFMKVSGVMEGLQDATCTSWINKGFPARCAAFDRERWLDSSQKLPKKEMKFCIDRFEYPNLKGANPAININWFDAEKICKSSGKRLCTVEEWTFACEGEEATPYPYGYERADKLNEDACNIDRGWKQFKGLTKEELARLWQGKESGSMKDCKSIFGVYDMTGNVDEWTSTIVTKSGNRGMKGGYWGPVRNRCRPTTDAHGPTHSFYQQGFRCCDDVPKVKN